MFITCSPPTLLHAPLSSSSSVEGYVTLPSPLISLGSLSHSNSIQLSGLVHSVRPMAPPRPTPCNPPTKKSASHSVHPADSRESTLVVGFEPAECAGHGEAGGSREMSRDGRSG